MKTTVGKAGNESLIYNICLTMQRNVINRNLSNLCENRNCRKSKHSNLCRQPISCVSNVRTRIPPGECRQVIWPTSIFLVRFTTQNCVSVCFVNWWQMATWTNKKKSSTQRNMKLETNCTQFWASADAANYAKFGEKSRANKIIIFHSHAQQFVGWQVFCVCPRAVSTSFGWMKTQNTFIWLSSHRACCV